MFVIFYIIIVTRNNTQPPDGINWQFISVCHDSNVVKCYHRNIHLYIGTWCCQSIYKFIIVVLACIHSTLTVQAVCLFSVNLSSCFGAPPAIVVSLNC